MVYGPASQANNLSPELGAGDPLRPRVGLAKQGEQVYRENGCYYCHTRAAIGGTFGYEIQITQLGDDRQLNAEAVDRHGKYSEKSVYFFRRGALRRRRDGSKKYSSPIK